MLVFCIPPQSTTVPRQLSRYWTANQDFGSYLDRVVRTRSPQALMSVHIRRLVSGGKARLKDDELGMELG